MIAPALAPVSSNFGSGSSHSWQHGESCISFLHELQWQTDEPSTFSIWTPPAIDAKVAGAHDPAGVAATPFTTNVDSAVGSPSSASRSSPSTSASSPSKMLRSGKP